MKHRLITHRILFKDGSKASATIFASLANERAITRYEGSFPADLTKHPLTTPSALALAMQRLAERSGGSYEKSENA